MKVDPGQLRKALAYLIWYLDHHSAKRATVALAVGCPGDGDGHQDVRISISSPTVTIPASDVAPLFDPVRMVQENLIDIGPAVSQRIVEALGGRLEVRHGPHELAFVMRLPAAV